MMEWTNPHWRSFIRGVTRKTVLYTEMVVDSTITHQANNLDVLVGQNIFESPSVVQLGGNDPEELGKAVDILDGYGAYNEFNLNCGCPSDRVASKRCFGAKLMLQPELVRQIVTVMGRRTCNPITIKCRLGVDDHDSYEELTKFIQTTSTGGIKKYIIHARKCLLKGLSCKQNREIPPLHYDWVHRLQQDFPDLRFVLNGGIKSFDTVKEHMNEWNELPGLEGGMIGRQAYSNPLMFAEADSTIFNTRDPCPTRRACIERYLDYTDHIQSTSEPVVWHQDKKPNKVAGALELVLPLHSLFTGIPGTQKYKKTLNDCYQKIRKTRFACVREIVEPALEVLPEYILDKEIVSRERLEKGNDVDTNKVDTSTSSSLSVSDPSSVFHIDAKDDDDDVDDKFSESTPPIKKDNSKTEALINLEDYWNQCKNEFKDRDRTLHPRYLS